MALITWNDSYSVGVSSIDTQHQRLISLINQLHELMKAGEANSVLGPVLDDLISYANTHFSFEEKYFDEFHYEGTLLHKLEHKKFVETVTKFQTDFKNGNTQLTIDVMNFLRDWLLHHINGTDKKYTKCFNEHGIK